MMKLLMTPLYALIICILSGCTTVSTNVDSCDEHCGEDPYDILDDVTEKGATQTAEFGDAEIIKLADNIYVAAGYGVTSSTMVIGPDGLLIVDTLESVDSAETVLEEFRRITDKPVKAIIYTHHHFDHVNGAKAFVNNENSPPEGWVHEIALREHSDELPVLSELARRSKYQFGVHVPQRKRHELFWGTHKFSTSLQKPGKVPPTKFISDEGNVTIIGINIEIFHIPGESRDHIGLWFHDSRVLIAGDIIYKSVPNVAPIRGGRIRDVLTWTASLRKIQALRPRCLVTGHYRPICGEDKIYDLINDYVAGMTFLHDQTVRYINKGYHPLEIVKVVQLPAELKEQPFLMELYGSILSFVRSVYTSYIGWFSGEAVDLNPLTPSEMASRMVRLVGSERLLETAKDALTAGDHQWALETSSYVFVQDKTNVQALLLRRQAMKQAIANTENVVFKLYLSTIIMEDAGLVLKTGEMPLQNLPIHTIFETLPYRVHSEKLDKLENISGCFYFSDLKRQHCLVLDRGVLRVVQDLNDQSSDFDIITTENHFRNLFQRNASEQERFAAIELMARPDADVVQRVFSYLDL